MEGCQRDATLPGLRQDFADSSWVGRTLPDTDLVVEEMVAETNMSTVYRVRSRHLARQFCAKFVPRKGDSRRRWELEIRMLAEITSPHVVKLFRTLEVGEHVVIVTDWAPGKTLQDHVTEEGPLSPEEVVSLGLQVAQGLHEVHERGAVHRDMKPANIMLERLPSGDLFARILDFGIAKVASDDFGTTGFIGSPLYAAPEQITDKTIDARTDLYALGCVLYFALTGQPPFSSGALYALMWAHLNTAPPLASQRRPALRDWGLDELIARLMAKDPAARPDSCRELIDGLEESGPASPRSRWARNVDDEVSCVADEGQIVSARRRQLIVKSGDRTACYQLPLDDEHVTALHYQERERAVYWATQQGRLFRTPVDEPVHEEVAQIEGGIAITGLSGVKRGVIAVDGNGAVHLLSGGRCDLLWRPAAVVAPSAFMIAGAANGESFVTTHPSGEVCVHEGNHPCEIIATVRPPFAVRSLAVSPDGYVAALTGKGRLWVVSLLDGSVLHELHRDLAGTHSVCFQRGTLIGLGPGNVVRRIR